LAERHTISCLTMPRPLFLNVTFMVTVATGRTRHYWLSPRSTALLPRCAGLIAHRPRVKLNDSTAI
jgi:hypothetical protein